MVGSVAKIETRLLAKATGISEAALNLAPSVAGVDCRKTFRKIPSRFSALESAAWNKNGDAGLAEARRMWG